MHLTLLCFSFGPFTLENFFRGRVGYGWESDFRYDFCDKYLGMTSLRQAAEAYRSSSENLWNDKLELLTFLCRILSANIFHETVFVALKLLWLVLNWIELFCGDIQYYVMIGGLHCLYIARYRDFSFFFK